MARPSYQNHVPYGRQVVLVAKVDYEITYYTTLSPVLITSFEGEFPLLVYYISCVTECRTCF